VKLCTRLVPLGIAELCVGGPGLASSSNAAGFAVALDGSGDVIGAGTMTNSGTLSSFSVVKLSGDTGTELWRRSIDGTATSSSERAEDVVIDGSDDVIAVGVVDNLVTYSSFAVIKLSGSDGSLLWAEMLEGTRVSSSGDHALAVAVDGAGHVLAVGELYNDGTRADLAVVKLDASTGAELWRRNLDGSLTFTNGDDGASAVALDATGDVFVAGRLDETGSGTDFTVTRLDGGTGADVWSGPAILDGGANDDDAALALTLDASGDVIAAGSMADATNGTGFTVVKLDHDSGAVLWHQTFSGGAGLDDVGALAVTVDGGGDVIAAGSVEGIGGDPELTVVRLDGSTGALLWPAPFGATGTASGEATAWDVSVDGSGDIFAVGSRTNTGRGTDFTLIKLAQATGTALWSQDIDWTAHEDDVAYGVALHPSGDVIAAGRFANDATSSSIALLRFYGADGSYGNSGVCGDVNNDAVVDALDVVEFRAFLADPLGSPLFPAGVRQCTVIGSVRPCDGLDLTVVRRAVETPSLPPGIAQVCEAVTGP